MKTLPEDVTENLRPAFATLLAAVDIRFADRVQQRRQSVARSVQRTAPRNFTAHGVGRDARERAATFCFRKRADQFARGNLRRVARVEIGAAGAEDSRRTFFRSKTEVPPRLSFPVLGFTIALSLLTGLVMGLYPALQSSRADIVDALKEGGRGTAGSVRQQRFRKLLVGAQVAFLLHCSRERRCSSRVLFG